MPRRGVEPPCLAAQDPKSCVYAISPPGHETIPKYFLGSKLFNESYKLELNEFILPVNLTYSYKVVEYARPNMSSPQDPITMQKEAVPDSSRPFAGRNSTEQRHSSVVNRGTLFFSTPRLSPGTSTDPLSGPRETLKRANDQNCTQGTPSMDEQFSQATGKPLQK